MSVHSEEETEDEEVKKWGGGRRGSSDPEEPEIWIRFRLPAIKNPFKTGTEPDPDPV